MSQEQRFLGGDKVQTQPKGCLCCALPSPAIKAARTSRHKAPSRHSKRQAPGVRGVGGNLQLWCSHGETAHEGCSVALLGNTCQLGFSGFFPPLLELSCAASSWRKPGWAHRLVSYSGTMLLGNVPLERNDGFSGLPRIPDCVN